MEEQVEIMIPIKVSITLNGRASRDGKVYIKWFDNTEKVLELYDLVYHEYDILQVLQQLSTLYQLNPRMIKQVKITSI